MMIAHIVAAAKNGTIGVNNELPWNIPEDTKWFRDRTKGRALIMGRKTFDSVEHPLPKRLNVIVTRQKDYNPGPDKYDPTAPILVSPSIEDAVDKCRKVAEKYMNEIFIIGGGEIYKQSMDIVDTIYMTRIHRDVKGDAVYPDIDPKIFKLVEKKDYSDPEPFSIETWVRKSKG